jgi:hypothetical protein
VKSKNQRRARSTKQVPKAKSENQTRETKDKNEK